MIFSFLNAERGRLWKRAFSHNRDTSRGSSNFVSHAAFFVSSRNASSQGALGDKRKTAAEKII